MTFEIKIINLHWINETNEDPNDLCLHGNVFVKIGNKIIDDGVANLWTVSSGAYRMLETLYRNHNDSDECYEEHLLPCCGHFMFVDEKTDKLIICGCPNGIDWTVIHENNMVKLVEDESTQIIMPFEEYKNAVFNFADKVKMFYDKCLPKHPNPEDAKAYQRFWLDWEKFRNCNTTI